MARQPLSEIKFELPPSMFSIQSFDPRSLPDCYDISRKRLDLTSDEHYWGEGIHIVSLDSGVDPDHCEFGSRVTADGCVSNAGSGIDQLGHGTAVMSKALGANVGVAKLASGTSIKVTDDSGRARADWVCEGFRQAIKLRPHFINASIGSTQQVPELEELCQEAMELGILIVTASGNDFSKKMRYPAEYESCVSVGAITRDNTRLPFSNYNFNAFALEFVDYGEELISAQLGGIYRPATGTSHATPLVTGQLALRLRAEQGDKAEPKRWEWLKKQSQLQAACKRLAGQGRSKEYGWGQLDPELLFGPKALPHDFRVLAVETTAGVVSLEDIRYGVVYRDGVPHLVVDGKYFKLEETQDE